MYSAVAMPVKLFVATLYGNVLVPHSPQNPSEVLQIDSYTHQLNGEHLYTYAPQHSVLK